MTVFPVPQLWIYETKMTMWAPHTHQTMPQSHQMKIFYEYIHHSNVGILFWYSFEHFPASSIAFIVKKTHRNCLKMGGGVIFLLYIVIMARLDVPFQFPGQYIHWQKSQNNFDKDTEWFGITLPCRIPIWQRHKSIKIGITHN